MTPERDLTVSAIVENREGHHQAVHLHVEDYEVEPLWKSVVAVLIGAGLVCLMVIVL